MSKAIFRGMLFGLPIILACWIFVYFNAKSHTAWLWANLWYGAYTIFVLAGYFWPREGPSSNQG